MKTRQQHNRHKSKYVIKFYSQKNSSHIWCESFLERNHALTLEFDDNVECYTSQPGSIDVHGKRYTPDFLVAYHNQKPEFQEVKHSEIAKKTKDFDNKFSLQRTALLKLTCYNLSLITEKEVHKHNITTLNNLYRFLDVNIDHIIELVELPSELELCKLIEFLAEYEENAEVCAWALIAQGHYRPTPFHNITPKTVLTKIGLGRH